MSTLQRPLFAVMATLLLAPAAAQANPWTRQAGKGYVNLSYQRISAGSFYGPSGDSIAFNGTKFTQQTVNLFAELGVIDRYLTFVFDATLFRRGELSNQGATQGLGDLRFGLWSGIWVHGNMRLAVGMLFGVPSGDAEPAVGGDGQRQGIARSLPTGDGEFDVEARLAFGTSFGGPGTFWPLVHYVRAEAGYWLRTNGFADAFNYHFELGLQAPWPIVRRFWLIARLFGSESFASPEEAATAFSGLGNGVSYASYGLEIYLHIWQGIGVSGAFTGAFRARNLPAGAQLKAALSMEF